MKVLQMIRKIIFGILYYPLLACSMLFSFLIGIASLLPWLLTFVLIIFKFFELKEAGFQISGGEILMEVAYFALVFWLSALLIGLAIKILEFFMNGFWIFASIFGRLGGFQINYEPPIYT